jgi:hypothetical protein
MVMSGIPFLQAQSFNPPGWGERVSNFLTCATMSTSPFQSSGVGNRGIFIPGALPHSEGVGLSKSDNFGSGNSKSPSAVVFQSLKRENKIVFLKNPLIFAMQDAVLCGYLLTTEVSLFFQGPGYRRSYLLIPDAVSKCFKTDICVFMIVLEI